MSNRVASGAYVLQGSEKTTMLDLGGSRKRKFQAENFSSMPNLHFLRLPEGCVIDGDLGCMSGELRWLQWKRMPFAHAPAGLNLSHLTSLDFSGSTNLASLWTEASGDKEVRCGFRVINDICCCKTKYQMMRMEQGLQ